jgi:hypothetical protein
VEQKPPSLHYITIDKMITAKKRLKPDEWRPFDEARAFVRTLGLKSQTEWKRWARSDARPIDIPVSPHVIYKNKGWLSLGDWLGNYRVASQNIIYRPFDEARKFARSLKLRNINEWGLWAHSDARSSDIPISPHTVYKDKGWINWSDWLGTRNIKGGYQSFEEARVFVHSLEIKGQTDWKNWAKTNARPINIPANPYQFYKDKGWVSWGDWLGTSSIANINRLKMPARSHVI